VPSVSARHAAAPSIPETLHRGFLSLKRRYLVMGSLTASILLLSVAGLPYSANAAEPVVIAAPHQSYTAPPTADLTVARDGFDISSYALAQWPVPPTTIMSSTFGFRSCDGCSSDHRGIDLNPGNGFPVQAVAAGVVVEAIESHAGLGVHVVVEHVIDRQVVQTVYGHMQFGSLEVAAGDRVVAGQQLGVVGSTGQSTGAHLHFEVIVAGVQIDPLPWLITHASH
jgi:murein DD-endopeptidase MepM/ murein hydrolase activator NlpD